MYCCDRDSHDQHESSCKRTWRCGCKKALDDQGHVREFQHVCPRVMRHVFDEQLNEAILSGGSDGILRLRFTRAPDGETLKRLRKFMRWDGRFWTCLVTTSNVAAAREIGLAPRGPYDGPKLGTLPARGYDRIDFGDDYDAWCGEEEP